MREINDGDTIQHIFNIWEQMIACPLLKSPESDFEPQEQIHYLDMLDEQINQIIFLVGTKTIPTRVNNWLKKARPGYYIPFHLVFEDELPRIEDRMKVLNFLAFAPTVVESGIVDAANGLIYRYNLDPKRRALSFLLLLLGLTVATAIVGGAAFLRAQDWPLGRNDLGTLLIGWGAVLIGMTVHVGIGSVKRSQARGALPPVIAVGELPLITSTELMISN